jgi:hypothetical protein
MYRIQHRKKFSSDQQFLILIIGLVILAFSAGRFFHLY